MQSIVGGPNIVGISRSGARQRYLLDPLATLGSSLNQEFLLAVIGNRSSRCGLTLLNDGHGVRFFQGWVGWFVGGGTLIVFGRAFSSRWILDSTATTHR